MNKNTPKYSVIVSVFNSEKTISELMNRLDSTMQQYGDYEILFIDDFSTDDSWNQLIKSKNGRENIRLIRLTNNFGQAKVLLCGINQSNADTIISIDDDLQYPPEEIDKLIANFNPQKHYILFGVPEEKKDSFSKRISSKIIESIINNLVIGSKKKLKFSSFRIFTRKIHKRSEYNESTLKNVQIFFNMVSPSLMDYVFVSHETRKKGNSSYTLGKRLFIGLELLLTSHKVTSKLFAFNLVFSFLLTILTLLFAVFKPTILSTFLKYVLPIFFLLFNLLLSTIFFYIRKLFLDKEGGNDYSIWEEC